MTEFRRPAKEGYVWKCIKGKSKTHKLYGKVQVPIHDHQVEDFCKEICKVTGACSYLISTRLHEGGAEGCPARCKASKRGDGNGDGGRQGKRGRKKKSQAAKASNNQTTKSSTDTDETEGQASAQQSRSNTPDGEDNTGAATSSKKKNGKNGGATKANKWENILPKSEIRTRGAKLPDFKLHFGLRPSKREAEKAPQEQSTQPPASKKAKVTVRKDAWKMEPAFCMEDIGKPVMTRGTSQSQQQPLRTLRERPQVDWSMRNQSSEAAATSGAPVNTPEPLGRGLLPSLPPIRPLVLNKNPAEWTSRETAAFLASTPDCAHLAGFMVQDEVDGPSFMLLNYPTVLSHWSLSTTSAVRLCRHVESVKLAFLKQEGLRQ